MRKTEIYLQNFMKKNLNIIQKDSYFIDGLSSCTKLDLE